MAPLVLRPSDIAIALQLALTPHATYPALAGATGLSLGESHNAVRRLLSARLVSTASREVLQTPFLEFLVHGVPHAFPGVLGPVTKGVPTAQSAPPLVATFGTANPVVWASADGTVRGEQLDPLAATAPTLVGNNPKLYQLLALVDALRIGRARERKHAITWLKQMLRGEAT